MGGDDLTIVLPTLFPKIEQWEIWLDTFKYHWTNLRETGFDIFSRMASNPKTMQTTIY